MRVGVDDPVVALAGRRVIHLGVVDHVVGAEGVDEVDLRGAADAGHLGSHRLRDLDRERTDVAGRAVDQDPVPRLDRPSVAQPESLDREDRGVRKRGRVVERHARRQQLESLLPSAHVLGEGASMLAVREQVREDRVARLEAGHARPDRLDDAGDVDPDAMVPRRAEPDEQPGERGSRAEAVEVGPVHGRRTDADEDLVVVRDRNRDVPELHDVERSVALLNGSLHRSSLLVVSGPMVVAGRRPRTTMMPAHWTALAARGQSCQPPCLAVGLSAGEDARSLAGRIGCLGRQ